MQHTDKARAEFEAWWIRQPHREQFEDLKQQFCNVAVAFYQKGREDVVIELPPAVRMPEPDSPDGEDYDDVDAFEQAEAIALTANGMRHACRAAIEAAGATARG